VLAGISCRDYHAAADAVPEAFGLAKSSVSRRSVLATARSLRPRHERRHDDTEWLVLLLDGKTFASEQVVIALGVTTTGEKRILGLVHTATENKRACAAFLRELVERGFTASTGLLVVLDGAKGLRAPSATHSLEKGLEATLTWHRLGVFTAVGASFKTTNLIERVMARVEATTHRVACWRTSDQRRRWCAAALLRLEGQFRRVKGYEQLPLLQRALQNNLSLATDAAA
jgi:transposase-like protein